MLELYLPNCRGVAGIGKSVLCSVSFIMFFGKALSTTALSHSSIPSSSKSTSVEPIRDAKATNLYLNTNSMHNETTQDNS